MHSLTVSLFTYSVLLSAARALNCSNPGIFVDIHERLVDGREDFFQYGLFIGLGTPSQNNSLWPAVTHNETVFSAPDYCSLDISSSCNTNFHGFISTEASSTYVPADRLPQLLMWYRWRDASDYQALDDSSTVTNTSVHRGTDTLNIWTHYFDPSPASGTYLHNFPATIVSNYSSSVDPFFGPGGTFGLGSSSTVLDRLYKDNLIGARSYGLYVGSRPDRAGGTQNGSVVLGGYDSGRFIGPLLSYEQVPALQENAYSPFKVSVSQLSLVTKQGQSIALVTDGAFDAYLTTSQFPVQFPTVITQRLATALNAVPANNDDNTLRTQNGFDGNLTITLSNNMTFTFDSSWISNMSNISPISARPLQTTSSNTTTTSSGASTFPILLGAAFLEQVYMFVQYESTPPSFSLAQALTQGKYVQPEPYCPNITPTPAVAPNINDFVKKGLTGAILGGLIGGGAFSALIWILFGRRLRSCLGTKSAAKAESTSHGKAAMIGPLSSLKAKTKRAVHFVSSPKPTFEYLDKSAKSKSTVTTKELEKSSSSPPMKSPPVQNIELSPLSESGITIQNASRSDNIITQQATYNPPPSAQSNHFNDIPLATPIPPTPHSAMPLLNNGGNQSGWPGVGSRGGARESQTHSRKPTLTLSTSNSSRPNVAPIPTFAPPPRQEEKPKRKSALKVFSSR